MKGMGHLPDLPRDVARDLRLRPLTKLIGAPTAPERVSYLSLAGPVFDQGPSSSCVGNACSKSLFTRAGIEGKPVPPISRKGIYDVARLIDAPYHSMSDDGSRPAAAFIGMADYGVVTEARWPLDMDRINTMPALDVFEHGIQGLVPDYYRIAPGDGCAARVRQALGRGYCPVFAMPVDNSYQSYDGSSIYGGLQGPELGGHYQCVVACEPDFFLVLNSWNADWGNHGLARISLAFFDSGAVTDVLVPVTAPEQVS